MSSVYSMNIPSIVDEVKLELIELTKKQDFKVITDESKSEEVLSEIDEVISDVEEVVIDIGTRHVSKVKLWYSLIFKFVCLILFGIFRFTFKLFFALFSFLKNHQITRCIVSLISTFLSYLLFSALIYLMYHLYTVYINPFVDSEQVKNITSNGMKRIEVLLESSIPDMNGNLVNKTASHFFNIGA